MKLVNIATLQEGINSVTVKNEKYFIYKKGENITLYDSVCPHQGARLFLIDEAENHTHENNEAIYCKVHNWRFFTNGISSNIENAKLDIIPHTIEANGDIYVHREQKLTPQHTITLASHTSSPHSSIIEEDNQQTKVGQRHFTPPPSYLESTLLSKETKSSSINALPNIRISLHAHACLEFSYNNFNLICDPWIEGSAFMGAWRNYPAPIITTDKLQPSMLYISHEHSDHCHRQTLQKLAKDIPIIIPSFPNGRLEQILIELGFTHITALEFGKRVEIAPDFYITLFEPASLWNDSQALLEIAGFRILNINDSGINHRVRNIVKHADMLCASFSPGASGYPATFTHLEKEEKISIYEKSRLATLEMLKEACALYNATYFLPFASHFILNNPEHIPYMEIIKKNTIYDVCTYFESSPTKILPMLAGDSFELIDERLSLLPRSDTLYRLDSILSHITEEFNRDEFEAIYPQSQDYTYDFNTISSYFLNLNAVPDIIFCEDIHVTVLPDNNKALGFSFEIQDGCLRMLDSIHDNAHLKITIPSEILMYICIHNESWDEATIGYWCTFERNPDIYHTEFWRLLQAPYFQKNLALNRKTFATSILDEITESSNLSAVLERNSELANKILSRYGLYCLTCNKAPMESVKQACITHGITESRMKRMIRELNSIL